MGAAANRYARALIDALYPDHAESGLKQLQSFSDLLKEEPEALNLLENPAAAGETRKKLLAEIAGALGFDKRVENFINFIVDRNRLHIFDEILDAYQMFFDERRGIVRAEVTAALPLDPVQTREIAAKLQKLTGKEVRMNVSVDPSLIGGVVAQVGGTIYDGSVRQQLRAFRNRLVE